ncbi:hypothetical protein FHS16_004898 [Paenibacillus endophyticus]|uniref:Uncharacterized protein n=1 Tax=Paenibacillus endophyticus TaxID=1294268 RepID=A0A7W5CBT3_9BACL|nr:hypothetical protein [Paenibacillus endophyticus]MBB3154816.1 hypothetical protein [Paenibacillus endophyticus]
MSSSIRSIRSIERSSAYTPVQAVSSYAYYPYRDGEPQFAPEHNDEWRRTFHQAAGHAASWLQTARQSQHALHQLSIKLGRELDNNEPIEDSLDQLALLVSDLENQYKQGKGDLNPELWLTIEQALRHPAVQEIGLHRHIQNGQWIIQGQTAESTDTAQVNVERMKRLLLGTSGLLTDIKVALAYTEQQKPEDLLQPELTATLPYAAYFNSVQTYSPVPYVGLIINQYL